MSREQYEDYTFEELLNKVEELEWTVVEYKKEARNTKKESTSTIESLQAELDALKKLNSEKEQKDFLEWKNISPEERKLYEDKIAKWYDKEDAYFLATKESKNLSDNQENISKNNLPGDDFNIWAREIKMSDLANLPQENYNSVMTRVDAGEMKVISD